VFNSAALVVSGIVLVGLAILAGSGPAALLASAGGIAVLAGWILGLARGTGLYRVAVVLSVLGAGAQWLGFLLITTGGPGGDGGMAMNELAISLGTGCWIAALAVGAREVHLARRVARRDGGPR
jgi:hypothetical protein